MPTVSDLLTIPYSGMNHIDALLGEYGPAWNYLTGNPPNTIYYSFSLDGYTPLETDTVPGPLAEFNTVQQASACTALDYLATVTGIQFVESSSEDADFRFTNADIVTENIVGQAYWRGYYNYDGDTLTRYKVNGLIYIDNAEYADYGATLAPGTRGYETLLHELGHMMGLAHPFSGDVQLPEAVDSTANTLMSYTHRGGPYTTYRPYDVAALYWLYGGDGLGGRFGADAQGRYVVGTPAADVLTGTDGDDLLFGALGNDTLDGGAGTDKLMSNAAFDTVHIERTATGYTVTGPDGVDTLVNIERAQFAGRMVALDIDGNGGSAYRLYQAAFDRAPDAVGLGYWIGVLDGGVSLRDVAAGFIASDEFARLYQGMPDDATFVDSLYRNILHRAPEQGGYDFWVGALAGGGGRADVLSAFSESFENKDALAAVIGNGFEYTPYYG